MDINNKENNPNAIEEGIPYWLVDFKVTITTTAIKLPTNNAKTLDSIDIESWKTLLVRMAMSKVFFYL